MSALAGRWNFDGKPDAEASCARMLAAQRIYGPHDERRWSDGDLALGRRLYRVLPEDRFDRQPLIGAGGRLVLVADLRLDNREALEAALGIGEREAARLCDAALLLRAIERWDEDAVDRIVGDFAFALWDARERRLTLARDFVGQRPLHYHRGKDFFAFATMPKGLHALSEIPYAPDTRAVAEFLTRMPEAAGGSFFEGVSAVEPGQVLTVSVDAQRGRRFWTPDRRALTLPRGEDFVEGLRHHLDQAVRARLRGANGAVASQLSGGWDSGAVTATAARLLGKEGTVSAFTAVPRAGYDRPVPAARIADEGPLAAATAALYPNIDHVLIRAGNLSPVEHLDRYFYLFDRPAVNLCNHTWVVAICEAARERGLNVMLTGQMGNMTISYSGIELLPELAGQGRLFTLARVGAQLVAKRSMRWRGVLMEAFGRYMPAWLWNGLHRLVGRESKLLDYAPIRPSEIHTLGLGRIARERGVDFSYRPRRDGFEARLWVLRRVVAGNYNKGMLAGWGIDQRDPTVDRRLVEYCLGVPMDAYLADGELRSLPRRALADRLPTAVLAERGKGYQAADWHEGLTAARDALEAEVKRFGACGPAAQILDIARLQSFFDNWPKSGWERPGVFGAYRGALLGGVSGGHFLRKASGANR